MKNGIRRPAQRRDQYDRVFERLARHDVARFQIEFQQISDGGAGPNAFIGF
jgi:hypothetical protein